MSPNNSDGSPVIELAFAVKAAQREISRRLNEAFRPLGVSCVQADVLIVLGEGGPMTLSELSERIVAESGHPSRLVDRMVSAGLVTRAPSEIDRRRLQLALSQEGEALLARVLDARAPLVAALERELPPEAVQQVTAFLRGLTARTQSSGITAAGGGCVEANP